MARRPTPLPPALEPAFTTAQAHLVGVRPDRLRAGDLRTPTSGVRSRRSDDITHVSTAHAYALVLPRPFAFSHETAARLLGLPVPRPWRADQPLHVMRPTGTPLLLRAGITSHRGLERRYTEFAGALPVTDPLETWADLAGTLAEDDVLAVADALLAVPGHEVGDTGALTTRRTSG